VIVRSCLDCLLRLQCNKVSVGALPSVETPRSAQGSLGLAAEPNGSPTGQAAGDLWSPRSQRDCAGRPEGNQASPDECYCGPGTPGCAR
jgi:hypothetical protein